MQNKTIKTRIIANTKIKIFCCDCDIEQNKIWIDGGYVIEHLLDTIKIIFKQNELNQWEAFIEETDYTKQFNLDYFLEKAEKYFINQDIVSIVDNCKCGCPEGYLTYE